MKRIVYCGYSRRDRKKSKVGFNSRSMSSWKLAFIYFDKLSYIMDLAIPCGDWGSCVYTESISL